MPPVAPNPIPTPSLTSTPSEEKKAPFPTDKIIGYILLFSGVLLILVALFLAFNLLTGKSKPPTVFNVEAPTINLPTNNLKLQLPENTKLPAGMTLSQDGSETPQGFKVIPDEVLNGSLNIGLSYLLFMFIASSGAKLASIGVSMVKDIKVTVKEDKLKT